MANFHTCTLTKSAELCIFQHALWLLARSDLQPQRWPQRRGWNTRTTQCHLISSNTLIWMLFFSFSGTVITAISLCVMSSWFCSSFPFLTIILSVAVFFVCVCVPHLLPFPFSLHLPLLSLNQTVLRWLFSSLSTCHLIKLECPPNLSIHNCYTVLWKEMS